MPLRQLTPDITAQLKDDGLIGASAAWQTGGVNLIHDLGSDTYTEMTVHLKLTAIEIASNDELYRLVIQGSSSATFADTFASLGELTFGANEVLLGDVDSVIGSYVLICHNDVGGTVYRYIRGFASVTGAVATGIDFQAWMTAIE